MNLKAYYLNEDEFSLWDKFIDNSSQGSIFCRSWWLKAVCPHDFKILIIKNDNRIVAGIPLPISKKYGYTAIDMPPLTQVLGTLILTSKKSTYEGKLSDEMEILDTLVKTIPKFGTFNMRFHYNFTNWLPFYWQGYQQTTRYTYIIKDLTNLNNVFADFAHSKRKNIKKAEQSIIIKDDLSSYDFYKNHKMTLAKQGESINYNFELFKRIYDAVIDNSAGRIWCAIDKDQNIHAAIFIIYDRKSAYYLISTIDPDFRNSGAATLLIKEAITYVAKFTQQFDFEGSMIRGIENSFRKFGAVQTPYFSITKEDYPLPIKLAIAIKNIATRSINKFS